MITIQTLAQSPLFAGLTEAQLFPFMALAEEITCPRGRPIFEEGEHARRLFILLSGKVNIRVQITTRPEPISVATLDQPGQLVGWSGFMPPNDYTATALCQDHCRFLVFEGAAFMSLLETTPAVGFIVMRNIAEAISDRLRNVQRIVLKTL
jgi:CRP-like cAMP-binding protein